MARLNRLYKNKREGRLFGVCAGVADYFNFNITLVRIITFVSLLFFAVPTLCAYFVAALILEDKPVELYEDREQDQFGSELRASPSNTLNSVKHRFYDLEKRLQRMEKEVTSKEFRFEQELRGKY